MSRRASVLAFVPRCSAILFPISLVSIFTVLSNLPCAALKLTWQNMETNTTNFVYVVNSVSLAQDWAAISEFFFIGFKFGMITGGLVWIILLVKRSLAVPRWPGGRDE